jgi:hypothetical protein
MNASILTTNTQLKVLVERVVRPLKASTARKRKVREELLGHVTAVFEEEARKADEAAALDKTRLRFGAAEELTAQLQMSMQASDTINYYLERLLAPPGESVWRCAVRHALIAVVASAVIFAAAWSLTAQPSEITLGALLQLGAILGSVFLLVLELYFLVELMRRAVYEPARPKWQAWLVGTIAFIVFPVTVHVPTDLFSSESSLENLALVLIWFAISMVLLVGVLANLADKKLRYQQEWAMLPID